MLLAHTTSGEIRRRAVNVLVSNGNAQLTVADLSAAGVARISVGGALARAALGGSINAAAEIHTQGTFTYGRTTPRHAEIERRLSGPA